jgi:integrase
MSTRQPHDETRRDSDATIFTDHEKFQTLTLTTPPSQEQNAALVYLESLASQGSRRAMKQALNAVAGLILEEPIISFDADSREQDTSLFYIAWGKLRHRHTAMIRAMFIRSGDYAPATISKFLVALRQTLKHAWLLGQMSAEDYYHARNIKTVPGKSLPAGRDLSGDEIMALINVCQDDDSPAGPRDAAIIACLYPGGLRRSEIAALQVDDYALVDAEAENERLTIGSLNVLHGKSHEQRIVYLAGGAAVAMADWLTLRGNGPGTLFLPVDKGGTITFERDGEPASISSQAIYNMLAKRGKQTGVENFSPHDFRRTFVGNMLDVGVDIVTVSKLAGHSNPATTASYDRRGERAKQEAAGRLHFPYSLRFTSELDTNEQ